VEAAQAAIMSAKIEARCNVPNGIGIVKLMGRSAGFIAGHATLASGDVDLCLVPEVSIQLEGEDGCLPFLMQRVSEQGHAVVVVAEGAGEDIMGMSQETDKGGNRKLPPIGVSDCYELALSVVFIVLTAFFSVFLGIFENQDC
jgi:6-phosphofructokinase 1